MSNALYKVVLRGTISKAIKKAEINEEGKLILTLTDNALVDLGKVTADCYMRAADGFIQFSRDEKTWENVLNLSELKGDKGDPFKYEDFTPEQIEALRGPKGDTFTFNDLTDEEKAELKGEKGDALTYEDLNDEQKNELKGAKGDPFAYEDFTEEQLEELKGDPLTYDDMNDEQKDDLKRGVINELKAEGLCQYVIGSYKGNGSLDGVTVELGFNPKAIFIGCNAQSPNQNMLLIRGITMTCKNNTSNNYAVKVTWSDTGISWKPDATFGANITAASEIMNSNNVSYFYIAFK